MSKRLQVFFVLLGSLIGSLSFVAFVIQREAGDSARRLAWPLAIIFWALLAAAGLIVLYWEELQAANRQGQTPRR